MKPVQKVIAAKEETAVDDAEAVEIPAGNPAKSGTEPSVKSFKEVFGIIFNIEKKESIEKKIECNN